MLSCRTVKGPLIFVSVLMHRETNLQVENEETIEAQSARTPKRCWTESNSAFSFVCAKSIDRAVKRRCVRGATVPRRVARASRRPPVFVPVCRSIASRRRAATRMPFGLTRLASANRVRYTQLSPTERSGKSGGSSPTSRMQKTECGWMRSAGRWIGARGATLAARSGARTHRYAPAVASRSAAGMLAPGGFAGTAVSAVVASASEFAFAFPFIFAFA